MSDLIQDDKKAAILSAVGAAFVFWISTLMESIEAKAHLESAAYMLLSFVPMAYGRAALANPNDDEQGDDEDADE